MGRRSLRGLAWAVVMITPVLASPQNTFELTPTAPPNTDIVLGGTPSIDLIILQGSGPSVPLRHGNVMPGSERVEFDGRVLRRGSDYNMDYETGVVYLMRAQKPGQSLHVSYRYDATKTTDPAQPRLGGLSGFRFDVAPGALQMIMGFGVTERTADGNVLTSNLYGWNNSFSFAGSSIKGLMLVGERQKVNARNAFGAETQKGAVDEGKSRFLLQNFQTALAGGRLEADYQDISSNFSGFGAVQESGYEKSFVDSLQKEKGLKRLGIGITDVGVGGMKFSHSYRTVEDAKGSIDWRKLGMAAGNMQGAFGFSMNWESRTVDKDFQRFRDIREADRDQLMREAGITRETLSGQLKASVARMAFSSEKIEDLSGNGIYKRSFELFDGAKPDSSKIYFSIGDQHVEQGFNRMGSLLGPEQQAYGRELGLRRQWMAMHVGLFGAGSPIKYNVNAIRTNTGDFNASKLTANGKSWSLEHVNASVDKGFGALDALPDREKIEHIKTIANMYSPGGAGVNVDAERGWLNRSAGIDRNFTRLTAQPFKGWNMSFENLNLNGQTDSGSVQTVGLMGKGFSVNYRRQELGDNFNELYSLLDYERQRLGTISGLDRTDFGMSMKLGSKQFTFTQLKADSPQGGMSRTVAHLQDRKLDVQVTTREVDPGFNAVNQMVDPEKDMLATMVGFKERDIKAKWQILPNLNLDLFWFDSNSDSLNQVKQLHNTIITWSPSKNTSFGFVKLQQKNDDPLQVLFSNLTERINLSHNFGRMGMFRYLQEKQDYNGIMTNLPDSTKEILSYEAKIDRRTSLKTEQTRTRFENGGKENVSNNTISTDLGKRAGVSVSEINVDRDGEGQDETKRNYGFWIDLGNGLRFSYGYARQLSGENNGTMSSGMSLSSNPINNTNIGDVNNTQSGQIGNMQVGGAYGVNEWDQTGRTQSFAKVQLGTVKPMRLAGLHDVRFNFGLDTQADFSNWLRENRLIQFSGKLGSNLLQYEYKGQMHQSGARGIDRTFRFATDQDPKRWLIASIMYKLRTLPWDDQVMIRDFSLSARPTKNMSITHKLQTNPEGPQRGDVILGSVPQPFRKNEWRMDYKASDNLTIGGVFDEIRLEQNNSMARKGGVNMVLFQGLGSPLNLYYGVEQNDVGGVRRTAHRYHIRYDQRPGVNQIFSMFVGNEAFEHGITPGQKRQNWTVRVDYQLKF